MWKAEERETVIERAQLLLPSCRLKKAADAFPEVFASRQAPENDLLQYGREMVSDGFSGFSSPVVAMVM